MLTELLASLATILTELEVKYGINFVEFYTNAKKLWNKGDAVDTAIDRVKASKQHILRDLFYSELVKIPKERRDIFLRTFFASMIDYFRKDDKFIAAFVDINNQCNMSCENCINRSQNNSEDKTWTKELTDVILDKVQRLTRFIYISGGEPFLNPHLSDIIREHPELLFLTFTNGTMTSEYQKVIANNSNNVIFIVSVDGKLKDHELKRGVGSYRKAVETIKMLRANGYFCGVSTVVNPSNIEYVLQNAYLRKLKEETDVSFLYYLKEAGDNKEEFIRRYNELSEEMRKHIGAPIPTFNMPYGEIISKDKPCMAGDSILHIAVDGTVTPCPFLFNSCGNILNDDLDMIINTLKNGNSRCRYRE